MALTGNTERYGAIAQSIHWITAILVLVAFIVGEGGPEDRIYSAERADQLTLHESLGVAVLLLVVLRLIWRLFDRRPDELPMSNWMRLAAAGGHLALYLLLFAVPLTAMLGAWVEGHAVFTYLGAVPPPFGAAHDFGAWITELHTWLGDAIIWLAGFHAFAALVHHFLMKDRTLRSMLPWK